MSISHINNGDSGSSARTSLNAAIDIANNVGSLFIVAGPATTAKTYTLPNLTCSLLTSAATAASALAGTEHVALTDSTYTTTQAIADLAFTGTALSGLTAASALGGTELFYGVQSAADVKVTATQLKTFAVGAGSVSIATGKTLTGSNSITLAGTDSTTMTFPGESASIGYLGVPINSQNAGYTAVLADAGKAILMATAGTFTIPANASVAYPIGTVLTFINGTTSCTIPITSDTMTLAGSATTGTRTLAANGIATAIKTTSTTWIISGTGLT